MTRERRGRPDPRRAFSLIFVLTLVVLAGALLTLVTASVSQLVKIGRHESQEMQLRQMIDSGVVWARAHHDHWPVEDGHPRLVTLAGESLLPSVPDATITLVPLANAHGSLYAVDVMAMVIRPSGRVQTRRATVTLP